MHKFRKKNFKYTDDGYVIYHGVGVFDVGRKSSWYENINGKPVRVYCPLFKVWRGVLQRTYCQKLKLKHPTYRDATVCNEWLLFSNFEKWVNSQPNKDWQNCELDKDLLIKGNKHYSPENCVFVSNAVNEFLKDAKSFRGEYMIGVVKRKHLKSKPFQAACANPFDKGKPIHIGYYGTEIEAHLAWKAKKHELALQLADTQSDQAVALSLSKRYAPSEDWSKS